MILNANNKGGLLARDKCGSTFWVVW